MVRDWPSTQLLGGQELIRIRCFRAIPEAQDDEMFSFLVTSSDAKIDQIIQRPGSLQCVVFTEFFI